VAFFAITYGNRAVTKGVDDMDLLDRFLPEGTCLNLPKRSATIARFPEHSPQF
jgi:hypothetical protein